MLPSVRDYDFLSMLSPLLLAFSLALSPAQEARALRLDRSERLSPGEALRVEHVTSLRGQLSVWAESGELDLLLRVERDRGGVLEDDDTGGARNPWLRMPSEGRGERVWIEVRAKDAQASGAVKLCIRELPQTPESERAAREAQALLSNAERLDAEGRRIEARQALEAQVDACCALAREQECAGLIVALRDLARRCVQWSDHESFARANFVRREVMRGLYPPTSEAWSEVQLCACQAYQHGPEVARAVTECEEALRLSLLAFPPGNRNIPIVRFTVAQSHAAVRDLERAAELYREALNEAEAIENFDEVRLALFRSEFGALLRELGELPAALAMQRSALELIERHLPPDDDLTLGVLNNLAGSLNAMGENARSLELHERRCAALATRLPLDNIEHIHARGNRAVVRLALGDASRAASELEEVMAALERTPFADSEHADQVNVNLAEAWIATGRADAALARVEQQFERRSRAGRSDASMAWRLRVTAAHALRTLGQDVRALEAAETALEFAERAFPFENPDLAETRQLVAALRVKSGATGGARELAEAAALQSRAYFERCAELFTMQDAERAQQHWSRLVSDGVTLLDATRTPGNAVQNDTAVFELCESARAIGVGLLRAWRARGPAASSRHEPLRREVLRAAREVASVASRSSSPDELEAAIEARGRAEEALRAALVRERGAQPSVAGKSTEWARALGPDEALVAYWRLDQRALSAAALDAREPRLVAFVLRNDGRVRRHDFGALAPITAACRAWKSAALEGRDDLDELGAKLREVLVDPLSNALAGATRWRVALDDELHALALDALPLDSETLLGDRVSVVVVGSAAAQTRPANDGAAKLVAVGGVDYEASAEADESLEREPRGAAQARTRLARLARPEFAPLWETQDEIDGVTALFERAHSRESDEEGPLSTVLSERDATRANFLTALEGVTHLHIATHGFFALEGAEPSVGSQLLAQRSPLSLCGLALAGANDATNADGLLSADELALLDLRACELVVLSACDTNVGVASSGQGVASFQKALHAAGARHVITSLWKVDDAAARELMLAFYGALWEQKLDVARSLWSAKRKLRERRAPLRDWAGWVLSSQ